MIFFSHYSFYSNFTKIYSNFTQIPHKSVQPSANIFPFPSKTSRSRTVCFSFAQSLQNSSEEHVLLEITQIYSNLPTFTQIYSNSPTERPQAAQHTQTWSSLEPRTVLDIMCVFQHKTETKFRRLSDDT